MFDLQVKEMQKRNLIFRGTGQSRTSRAKTQGNFSPLKVFLPFAFIPLPFTFLSALDKAPDRTYLCFGVK
jgi:hypothetical protein